MPENRFPVAFDVLVVTDTPRPALPQLVSSTAQKLLFPAAWRNARW